MKLLVPLLSSLLTACFLPVQGEVNLGAAGPLSIGAEHTLQPRVTGGIALIEGPNGVPADQTTFPRHLSSVTGLQCSAPCQLVSGPGTDFSFVVRADQPGVATLSAEVALDNGEKMHLEERLFFVDVTALDARCVGGACPGPMARLVGTTSVWAVTGRGTTTEGTDVEVPVDDVVIEGGDEVVHLTRLPDDVEFRAALFEVSADAVGEATLTLRRGEVKREHRVRVVSPGDITGVSVRLARARSASPSRGVAGLAIDEVPTLDGTVAAQPSWSDYVRVALVGVTRAGTEVLGDARALHLQVVQDGASHPRTLGFEPQLRKLSRVPFSNWAAPWPHDLRGASALTLGGTLGDATTELTVPLSP